MNLQMTAELRQEQHLTPLMIQQMRILQMNTIELDEYIRELCIENPVIEIESVIKASEEADFTKEKEEVLKKLDWLESIDTNNRVYYHQEQEAVQAYSAFDIYNENGGEDLFDYLISQLNMSDYTSNEWEALTFIIQSLDDNGYYTDGLNDVKVRFNLSEERAIALLKDVKTLEPRGIASENVKECILIQAKSKIMDGYKNRDSKYGISLSDLDLIEKIMDQHMGDIAKHHLSVVAKKLTVPISKVEAIYDFIKSLNPKPANGFGQRVNMQYVTPDVVVVKMKDKFEILLSDYNTTKFTISPYYKNMVSQTEDKQTIAYLRSKIKQAEWVQNCVSLRGRTLENVVNVLVRYQLDFFIHGVTYRKPMKLSDIAEQIGVHESTVSRAMRGKFLQCSHGVFPLNYFLSTSAVAVGNNEKIADEVKKEICEIIRQENKLKPYSDQKISELLSENGIRISRRTVNKYRSEMGIPDKSGRRLL